LRIIRRIAVLLVALAPIGALVGVEAASGQQFENVTSITATPSTTGTQAFGAETDLNVTWDTTVTGIPAATYPEGTVTVVAILTTNTLDVTTLCSSDWDDVSTVPVLTTPFDVVNYNCAGPTNGTTLAPGTYDIESQLTDAVGDAGFAYNDADSTPAGTYTVTTAPTTLTTTTSPAADYTTPYGVFDVPAGAPITDSAHLSGGVSPTGTIYFFEAPVACDVATPLIQYATDTVTGNGTYTATFTPNTAGTSYCLYAGYGGDSNNAPSPVAGPPFTFPLTDGEGTFLATAATPTVNTTATTSTALGTAISDTVHIVGVSGTNATGLVTISAELGACPGGTGEFAYSADISTATFATASGVTTATITTSFIPSVPGTYYWTVTYGGDTNNSPAAEGCGGANETSTVGKATASTVTQVIDNATGTPYSGSGDLAGAAFHDTAVVSGVSPTGTVTYKFYDNSTCTGGSATSQMVTLAGGLVPNSASTGALAAGSYCYQASYSGDSNNAPATSAIEPFSVGAQTVPVITPGTLPDGIVGSAYSTTLAATGGVLPYHNWTISSGSLPPGLGINPTTGVISGTPSAGDSGTYTFSVTVQDSASPSNQTSAAVTFSITIGGPLTITAPSRLPNGNHGRMYSATITTSGGIAPLHFAITGGKLPPGLGINANTGVITGPAGATGTYTFTVTVSDSGAPQQSVSKTFTITVS
jgi:hypothetical protein